MNGTHTDEMFLRGAKVRIMGTDWTTIQDAFDSGVHDALNDNESNGSNEIDILRNETLNRPNTRSVTRNESRSSTSMAFDQPLISSTPNRESSFQQLPGGSHFSKSKSLFGDVSPLHTSNQSNLFTPPLNFLNSELATVLAPAPGFEDVNQNDYGVPVLPQQPPDIEYANESQTNEYESPSIDCSDLDTLLGADSLLYAIMKKLLKLWQKNIHPIKVDSLLAPRCNRFLAAKTFNSLLSKSL